VPRPQAFIGVYGHGRSNSWQTAYVSLSPGDWAMLCDICVTHFELEICVTHIELEI
jgi:hypothetical protein